MGWREFRFWLTECGRAIRAEAGRDKTEPDSWDGVEGDAWWSEQAEKHRQMRGR